MDETDLRDEIVDLEARIEELAAEIEKCRKLLVLSRIGMISGATLLVATTFGFVDSAAVAIGAIGALLGGIVLYGSNLSTWRQTDEALRATEAHRAELIGKIGLRLVHNRTLH
jgi:hypothetical protein